VEVGGSSSVESAKRETEKETESKREQERHREGEREREKERRRSEKLDEMKLWDWERGLPSYTQGGAHSIFSCFV